MLFQILFRTEKKEGSSVVHGAGIGGIEIPAVLQDTGQPVQQALVQAGADSLIMAKAVYRDGNAVKKAFPGGSVRPSVAFQHPGIHFSGTYMVMAYSLFSTLQHHVLMMGTGNKFGSVVCQRKLRPACIASVSRIAGRIIGLGRGSVWVVRVIAAHRLGGTALKTSGNNQISQTALNPGGGCYDGFQGGSALKVHCKGRNGF